MVLVENVLLIFVVVSFFFLSQIEIKCILV